MMTVEQDMRMSHVFQPLVLLALIEAGGSATLRQLEQRDPGRRDESCPGAPPPPPAARGLQVCPGGTAGLRRQPLRRAAGRREPRHGGRPWYAQRAQIGKA